MSTRKKAIFCLALLAGTIIGTSFIGKGSSAYADWDDWGHRGGGYFRGPYQQGSWGGYRPVNYWNRPAWGGGGGWGRPGWGAYRGGWNRGWGGPGGWGNRGWGGPGGWGNRGWHHHEGWGGRRWGGPGGWGRW